MFFTMLQAYLSLLGIGRDTPRFFGHDSRVSIYQLVSLLLLSFFCSDFFFRWSWLLTSIIYSSSQHSLTSALARSPSSLLFHSAISPFPTFTKLNNILLRFRFYQWLTLRLGYNNDWVIAILKGTTELGRGGKRGSGEKCF